MELWLEIKPMLMQLSDDQLDKQAKNMLATAINSDDILECLRAIAYYSWSSEFVVRTLMVIYDRMKAEETDAP